MGIYYRPDPETASITIPFVSVLETNQRALAVRAYAKKMGVPVIQNVPLARRILKTHKRYSFISLDAIDEIIQLMIWLHQVENAGYEEASNDDIPTALEVAARRPESETDEPRQLRDEANTLSQQSGGFKGERYSANNDSQEEVKAENSESKAASNNENKDSVETVSEK
ncbi:EscU/YscU/HrcU family type III secretion system export apparatus switch protein [Candidatus Regiella insecticola]|uniref:EscU/YscU/HrcU family type III secretion system export apparatus switch protein n=1 Tax=Candidatus Regiella insecticola TaxID=138073 RepID=UPI001F209A91|nr:EscU/YscU/HrcU family type III secretion system export apparatus switch protein [Candidatus Regiella insecticola]